MYDSHRRRPPARPRHPGACREYPEGAVEEVLAKLEGDERVKDLARLREAVLQEAAPAISENGCGICIAHGRTESVTSLVMAAGRSKRVCAFPAWLIP